MNADTLKRILVTILSVLILLVIGYVFVWVAAILLVAFLVYYIYKKVKAKDSGVIEAKYEEK